MDVTQYVSTIGMGFTVWLAVALLSDVFHHSERFLAYMVSLLFCLIGTSEIIMVKPVAFFFTVGGTLAFGYLVARSLLILRLKK